MRLSIILFMVITLLFISACESTTESNPLDKSPSDNSTTQSFNTLDLSDTWHVSQHGTYQETDTVDGQCSDYYPYESPQWDSSFTINSLFMRGDTLMIAGWFVTKMNLDINFWGVGTGSTISLKGTRMNSPATSWVEGEESYKATATIQSDGSISLAITTYSQYYMGGSIHGQGEKSSATLYR